MFFDVGVLRTVTATRYVRVEADSKEEAEGKAMDMAGDEDWGGCVTDYDFDLCGDTKEVADLDTPPGFEPEPVEGCVFCGKEMPDVRNPARVRRRTDLRRQGGDGRGSRHLRSEPAVGIAKASCGTGRRRVGETGKGAALRRFARAGLPALGRWRVSLLAQRSRAEPRSRRRGVDAVAEFLPLPSLPARVGRLLGLPVRRRLPRVRLPPRLPLRVGGDRAEQPGRVRKRTMNPVVAKIEERIEDRRREMEGWEQSLTACDLLCNEIEFLEGLLKTIRDEGYSE